MSIAVDASVRGLSTAFAMQTKHQSMKTTWSPRSKKRPENVYTGPQPETDLQ